MLPCLLTAGDLEFSDFSNVGTKIKHEENGKETRFFHLHSCFFWADFFFPYLNGNTKIIFFYITLG